MRGTIACYPPVWGTNDPNGPVSGPAREASLRTVVCTEAVATCLGASALLFGDVRAVLCDPYYPKHERLSAAEVATVLAWHRFALRYRDLFLEGEDTSWYDVGDDNGAVRLDWDGPVRPEPARGDRVRPGRAHRRLHSSRGRRPDRERERVLVRAHGSG